MSPKNTNLLLEKYPKLFNIDNNHIIATPFELFAFECNDGWFNIIDSLCQNIQGHIDFARKQRARNIIYNRALKRALNGDTSKLLQYYSWGSDREGWAQSRVEKDIEQKEFRSLFEKVRQVKVLQVKEKFGTLRFYYEGGDKYVSGLVAMAETMSGVTCEKCGNVGKIRNNGYIQTLCDDHDIQKIVDK
jgi:hypothetical protein